MTKLYKRYLKCINPKCKRKYGTDNPKANPGRCPICVYLRREDKDKIQGGVIKMIKENEERNNNKKDK